MNLLHRSQPGTGYYDARYLQISNNLSDLDNAATARTNLGLGTIAVLDSIDISSHTNLAVSVPITLTGDTVGLNYAAPLSLDGSNNLYIAANAIKDTHIDWGTGAGQVSADDIPDGATNAIITLTQETNFETAYTHSQDNTQAHSDYLLNNADDTTTGVLTVGGIILGDGDTVGQAAGPLLTFDDTNNYLEITGCDVGIGTATPGYRLSVVDSNAGALTEFENTNAAGWAAVRTKNDAGNVVSFGIGGSTAATFSNVGYFNVTANLPLTFGTNNTERMRVDANGNVGIGTTSPMQNLAGSTYDYPSTTLGLHLKKSGNQSRLVVEGDFAAIDLIDLGGGVDDKWMQIRADAGITKFFTIKDDGSAAVANNILVLDHGSGKIGIGTASPSEELHLQLNVAGDVETRIENTNTGTAARTVFRLSSDVSSGTFVYHGSAHSSLARHLRIINNDAAGDIRFYFNGADNFVLSQNGRIGANVVTPLAKFHIDQSSTTAAIPVLSLDQADVSEGFINFIGSARGNIPASTAADESVRVELNGVVYRLGLFVDA